MLVIDATTQRDAWLAARWECVTGSGLAALTGLSPFSDRQTLLSKYITRNDTFKVNQKMAWGLYSEEYVGRALASILSDHSGRKVSFLGENTFRSQEGSCIGATCDGELKLQLGSIGPEDAVWDACPSGHKKNWGELCDELMELLHKYLYVPVELKLVGQDSLKYWNSPKKGPPSYYWAQCQAQMHVTGVDTMAIVAKVGAHDIRGHIVDRDDLYLEEAEEKATEFMKQVREAREL